MEQQEAGVSSRKRIRVTSTSQAARSEPSMETITLQSVMREIRQLREERTRMQAEFDSQLREHDNELRRMEERFQQWITQLSPSNNREMHSQNSFENFNSNV